jgi:hypothetical protein
MPHAYTEDQLVEKPAIELFAELGWLVALPHSHPGPLPGGEGAASRSATRQREKWGGPIAFDQGRRHRLQKSDGRIVGVKR